MNRLLFNPFPRSGWLEVSGVPSVDVDGGLLFPSRRFGFETCDVTYFDQFCNEYFDNRCIKRESILIILIIDAKSAKFQKFIRFVL